MQAVKSLHRPGLIGVISGDLARYPGFYVSLLNLKVPSGSSWQWVRGNGVAANRNIIAREAVGDWIWFIDDDHTFHPDTLMRLLDRNVPLIQPLVSTRKPPYHPYAYTKHGIGYRTPEWEQLPRSGMSTWDAIGCGGMLVRREVLDAVGDPWFEEGKIVADSLGEDLYFCEKARVAGFPSYIDSDVRLGHLTTAEVWPEQNGNGEWCIDLDMMHGVHVRVSTQIGRTEHDC